MTDNHSYASHDPASGLTADTFDELKESLEILYVLANISGRLKFAQKWPVAAEYVLGETLLRYDREGPEDREHRAEIEAEAEEKRLAFLALLDELEEKSVVKGALQTEYVSEMIRKLGRDLSLLIYQEKIVNRFAATVSEGEEPAPESLVIKGGEEGYSPFYEKKPGMSAEELEALEKKRQAAAEEDFQPQFNDDPMDKIQPISVDTNVVSPAGGLSKSSDEAMMSDPEEVAAEAQHVEAINPGPEIFRPASHKPAEQPPASGGGEGREGIIASDKHVFEVEKVEKVKPPPVINPPQVFSKPQPESSQQKSAAPNAVPVDDVVHPAPESVSPPPQQSVTARFVPAKKKPAAGSDIKTGSEPTEE